MAARTEFLAAKGESDEKGNVEKEKDVKEEKDEEKNVEKEDDVKKKEDEDVEEEEKDAAGITRALRRTRAAARVAARAIDFAVNSKAAADAVIISLKALRR